jgi:succinate dehydrogenase / fumarate reductase cytochrome b subunit
MAEIKRHDNRLGLWGWLGGGRWGIDRYAYILHRITGLGILFYLLVHIVVTSVRATGLYLWTEGHVLHGAIFEISEFLTFAAFAYHGLNGLRLMLVELGLAVGKPFEPVYPYKTSLRVQRPLFILMMILAAILFLAGGAEYLGFMK